MKVCPAGVYTKRESDGVVIYDGSKCISCFGCQGACPFSAPTYDYEAKHMKKCNMCTDETDANGVPDPACVKACPSRALDFGEIDELKQKYGTTGTIAAFGDSTKPNVVYNLHKDSVLSRTPVNPEEV
jgi:anaerobic dimethyl sulfoxide reductase subunit B (iron-sulfur subunit)